MKRHAIVTALSAIILAASIVPGFALEAVMIRESENPNGPAGAPVPCSIITNRNGTCSGTSLNYKWYNVCNNYIWIFNGWVSGEGVGVRFGGPGSNQPCVAPGKRVKRAIYYFRNIVPSWGQTVDLFLDADCNNDGCPEGNLGSALNVDPGRRWNCVNYGVCIPCGGVILRQTHDGGIAPTFATDGPFKSGCDPLHQPTHSYYYGVNGSSCVPWVRMAVTAPDDFLAWIVIDNDGGCPTATENSSWGSVKGLFQ